MVLPSFAHSTGIKDAISTITRSNAVVLVEDGSSVKQTLLAAISTSLSPSALLILPSAEAVGEVVKTIILTGAPLRVTAHTSNIKEIPLHFDVLVGTFHSLAHSRYRHSINQLLFGVVILDAGCNGFMQDASFSLLVTAIMSGATPRLVVVASNLPDEHTQEPNGYGLQGLLRLDINQQVTINGDDPDVTCTVQPLLSCTDRKPSNSSQFGKPVCNPMQPVKPVSSKPPKPKRNPGWALNYNIIDIVHTPPGVVPREERISSHRRSIIFNRVLDLSATAFTSSLTMIVLQMEQAFSSLDLDFLPPIKSGEPEDQWSSYVYDYMEKHPSVSRNYRDLHHWYEALNIVISSWEVGDWAAFAYLNMIGCLRRKRSSNFIWPPELASNVEAFCKGDLPDNMQALNRLCQALLLNLKEKPDCRFLVVTDNEIIAQSIDYFLFADPRTEKCIHAVPVYSPNCSITPDFRMTATEIERNLEDFADGSMNVLVTTPSFAKGLTHPFDVCTIRLRAGMDIEGDDFPQGYAISSRTGASSPKQYPGRNPSLHFESESLNRTNSMNPDQPTREGSPSSSPTSSARTSHTRSVESELLGDVDDQFECSTVQSTVPIPNRETGGLDGFNDVGFYGEAFDNTDNCEQPSETGKLVPIPKRDVHDLLDVDAQGFGLCETARKALQNKMEAPMAEPRSRSKSNRPDKTWMPSASESLEIGSVSTKQSPSRAFGLPQSYSSGTKVIEKALVESERVLQDCIEKNSFSALTAKRRPGPVKVKSKPKGARPTDKAVVPIKGLESETTSLLTRAQIFLLEKRYRNTLVRQFSAKLKAHNSIYAFARKVGAVVKLQAVSDSTKFASEMMYSSKTRCLSGVGVGTKSSSAKEMAANNLLAVLIEDVFSNRAVLSPEGDQQV